MTVKIALLDPTSPERLARIAAFLPEGMEIATAASRDPADQMGTAHGATYIISGDLPVQAEMLRAGAGTLKAVHKWGVGYDRIDCNTAAELGIRVLRTTGSNAAAVAETALAMMLALQRNILRGHMAVIAGGWPKGELGASSLLLSGKTVGIIGFGHIGKHLARLLAPFGCRVLYNKRTPLDSREEQGLGARYAPLDDLLAKSDIVSLHCDLNDQSRDMIDAAALARMRPGSLLINLARGGVVVEDALADALERGHLRGAALDVFATEPVERGNRLVGMPQVIVTPHLGAMAADNFDQTVQRMIDNLMAIHRGDEPPALDVIV